MSSTFTTEDLNRLKNLLGGNDVSFLLPLFESDPAATENVQDWGNHGLHGSNIVTFDNDPAIKGNMLNYRFNGTDEYMEIPDNDLLSGISAGVDAPFSVGCVFKMNAVNASPKILISKFDDQTTNMEWRFYLDPGERINFELWDDSVANAYKGREYNTPLVVYQWYVAVATYDGRGGPNPYLGMEVYLWDGDWLGAVDDTNNVGGGVYVDMENTTQPVMIGASDSAGGPVAGEFFNGDIALPFMTRRELSAVEARDSVLTMVRMMGL